MRGEVVLAVKVDVHIRRHTLAGCHVAHQLCDTCAVTNIINANQTLHIIFGGQLMEQLAVDAVLGKHVDVGVDVVQMHQDMPLFYSVGLHWCLAQLIMLGSLCADMKLGFTEILE